MCKQCFYKLKKAAESTSERDAQQRRTASLRRIQTPPSSALRTLYATDTVKAKSWFGIANAAASSTWVHCGKASLLLQRARYYLQSYMDMLG